PYGQGPQSTIGNSSMRSARLTSMSEVPDASDDAVDPGAEQTPAVDFGIVFRVPAFDVLPAIQRYIASIDFTAVRAAQQVVKESDAFRRLADAHNAIMSSFAHSIDFTRLTETQE